jgi:hypothetical protein
VRAEGCAVEAMTNAHAFVVGIISALDLLLDEKRLAGDLRRIVLQVNTPGGMVDLRTGKCGPHQQ